MYPENNLSTVVISLQLGVDEEKIILSGGPKIASFIRKQEKSSTNLSIL